jgi:hypothetical protein
MSRSCNRITCDSTASAWRSGAHAGSADLKRFQDVQRVTADEQFGTQAALFGAGGVLDQLQGENRSPPTTRHIVRWIAWAQLVVGWSALGNVPIPAVLKFP